MADWVSLSRLPDGRVMCCICFRYRTRDELLFDPEDGMWWDVCAEGTCAEESGLTKPAGPTDHPAPDSPRPPSVG